MVTFNGKSLAKMAKGNTVEFSFYRKGELWYDIDVDGKIFQFPVPISDAGDGIFLASDKATMFMRYIQKHLKTIETEKAVEY
jgi:hypothetical protein